MRDVRPPMVNNSKAAKYVRFFSLVLQPVFIQFNINVASTCIRVVMSSANQNKV